MSQSLKVKEEQWDVPPPSGPDDYGQHEPEWSASIGGSISGWSLIRVYPQLGASGAVDIREYPTGSWLNT